MKLALAWLLIWFVPALIFTFTGSSAHDLPRALDGPFFPHLLGFDAFGRDLALTLLRASATSALFALAAVVLSIVTGIAAGAGLALAPPRARFHGKRALELFLAFPGLLFALAIAAVRGPGWGTLIAALVIGTVPSFTRLMYARARELMNEEYVQAATALGASGPRIVLRHLSPALLSLSSVKAPGLFAHALLAEATLSFLGIGAPIGRDSWGSLLLEGKEYLVEAPHIAFATGVPLVLTVLALQLASDALARRHIQ